MWDNSLYPNVSNILATFRTRWWTFLDSHGLHNYLSDKKGQQDCAKCLIQLLPEVLRSAIMQQVARSGHDTPDQVFSALDNNLEDITGIYAATVHFMGSARAIYGEENSAGAHASKGKETPDKGKHDCQDDPRRCDGCEFADSGVSAAESSQEPISNQTTVVLTSNNSPKSSCIVKARAKSVSLTEAPDVDLASGKCAPPTSGTYVEAEVKEHLEQALCVARQRDLPSHIECQLKQVIDRFSSKHFRKPRRRSHSRADRRWLTSAVT